MDRLYVLKRDQSSYYRVRASACDCVRAPLNPITDTVVMLNRGCNQPVISHVHRKVCLADGRAVYWLAEPRRLRTPPDSCSKNVLRVFDNPTG